MKSTSIRTTLCLILGALVATIFTGKWESMVYFAVGIIVAGIIIEVIHRMRKNAKPDNLL